MTVVSWEIVPAAPADLDGILAIEEACFSAPWTRKMLEAELTGNPFAHFLLAREGPGRLVGYLCFWVVFEEVRFMNLAVIDSMRRRGIARSLVSKALQSGVSQAAVRAVLEVRATNQAAHDLYRSFGFREAGRRPRYYNHPVEDAVLMELEPIVPPSASDSRDGVQTGGQAQPFP